MRRLFAPALMLACAASCEVRSDLVVPPAGRGGASGAPTTPHEAGVTGGSHASGGFLGNLSGPGGSPGGASGGSSGVVAAGGMEEIIDTPRPDASPPDASSRDAGFRDASTPDAAPPDSGTGAGGCGSDRDCPWYNPRCHPQTRACVDCVLDDHCSGNEGICDPVLLRCVECVFDVDCAGRNRPLCRDSECTQR